MEFTKSQKGGKVLLYGGYRYRKDKIRGDHETWRCCKTSCSGRAITRSDDCSVTRQHNHAPNDSDNEVYRVKEKIRKVAKETVEKPRAILQESCSNLSEEATVTIGSYEANRQIIHRQRQLDSGSSRIDSLTDFELNDESKKTLREDVFLLYDSGKEDSNRIIIFGTNANLALLEEFSNWSSDGTFNIAPNFFMQVYTLHILVEGKALPVIYALMCNKKKETYLKFYQKLKELCSTLSPNSLLSDFETASYSAAKDVFADVEIVGCFFHLCQNLWRQIQKTTGLVRLYKENDDIRFQCKFLVALSFVPPRDVQFAFEILKETGFSEETELVVQYWENNYVGKRIENIPPRFPIEMWNMFNRLQENLPRSNNSLEAWHNSFQKNLDCHHPSVEKLIYHFKKEQSHVENLVLRYRTGIRTVESPSNKYVQKTRRLSNVTRDYSLGNILQYLKLISYNISL